MLVLRLLGILLTRKYGNVKVAKIVAVFCVVMKCNLAEKTPDLKDSINVLFEMLNCTCTSPRGGTQTYSQ